MLCLLICLFFSTPQAQAKAKPDWSYVEKQLRAAKFDKKFIAHMRETYEPKNFDQTIELNVLLFLRKRDDHGHQVSDSAVATVTEFMNSNRAALKAAEKEHGVAAGVIASLLWIESRHGQNRGRFHVPSVYLHLLQAPRPEIIAHLKAKASDYTPKVTKQNLFDIEKRTGTKATWAIAELRALQKMYKKDAQLLRTLRGSFAGAFGIPQFIPSSYHRWARTNRKAASPDLDQTQDAIQSVAFYLRDHGWRKGKKKSFEAALLKYNNSKHYARAILDLADKVDARRPAGHQL